MKEGKGVFWAVLLTMLLIPLIAFASYPANQYPNVTPIEKMHPNGKYIVYVEKEGKWQEAGSINFDKYFREREIDLTDYISNEGNIRVRLLQQGGGAAHIDSVSKHWLTQSYNRLVAFRFGHGIKTLSRGILPSFHIFLAIV